MATSLENFDNLLRIIDDEDDDEEVEIYSSENCKEDRASSHNGKLGLCSRPCISRELLKQKPEFTTRARYIEQAAVPHPFQVFYLLQALEKSIQIGALLTPSLFIPKEIWRQHQVRLPGVSQKIQLLQTLKQSFDRINITLPIITNSSIESFAAALRSFIELSQAQRNLLYRSFPFLSSERISSPRVTATTGNSHEVSATTDIHIAGFSASDAGIKIGKLTNLAVGFGRLVKKQAIAAVERVGSTPSLAVAAHELEDYAASLCSFISAAKSVESLVGVVANCEIPENLSVNPNDVKSAPRLDPYILEDLKELALFLDEVICELVLRDLFTLLDTYIRRISRDFGEIRVEDPI